jgi:hypothetical protein
LTDNASGFFDTLTNQIGGGAVGLLKSIWDINSPSKVFMKIAKSIPEGLAKGIKSDTSAVKSVGVLGNQITDTFQKSLSLVPPLDTITDIKPVIAPILDLTHVEQNAGRIGGLLSANPLTANVSLGQAKAVSVSTKANSDVASTTTSSTPTQVIFQQTNHSPKALSVGEIYRNTKNQISLAKEELKVA